MQVKDLVVNGNLSVGGELYNKTLYKYMPTANPTGTGKFFYGNPSTHSTYSTITESFLYGTNNTSYGSWGAAFGNNLRTDVSQMAIGHYNKSKGGTTTGVGTNGQSALIVGNGTASSTSNAFRVECTGQIYSSGNYNTSGADYAEYFEWFDQNSKEEDRRGYFVTLKNNKIQIATPNDYILGIISGNPSVIGNSDEDWQGRFIKDDFDTYIKEQFEYEVEEFNEATNQIVKRKEIGIKWKENPNYDPTQKYIPRADRSEWDAVGMLGVLSVRDDGTCEVNGYCTVADGGIATKSETGYRVIERINEHIVKIVFK